MDDVAALRVAFESWLRKVLDERSPRHNTLLAFPRGQGRRRHGVLAVFGPRMARIPAAQLPPNSRVMSLPESGKVGGHLHRAVIRREQVYRQRYASPEHSRRLIHPKEVLEA